MEIHKGLTGVISLHWFTTLLYLKRHFETSHLINTSLRGTACLEALSVRVAPSMTEVIPALTFDCHQLLWEPKCSYTSLLVYTRSTVCLEARSMRAIHTIRCNLVEIRWPISPMGIRRDSYTSHLVNTAGSGYLEAHSTRKG